MRAKKRNAVRGGRTHGFNGKGEAVQFSVRLPDDDWKRLKAIATQDGVTPSEKVRELIREESQERPDIIETALLTPPDAPPPRIDTGD